MKCARECPAKAISTGDKIIYNGYETWRLNVERCTTFRVTNPHGSGCGRCVKVCPWNKPEGGVHDAVRWLIRHAPLMNRLIIKADDLFGYGKQDERDKWWFDLEVMNGVIGVPGGADGQK
jgi:ferredoxin